MSEDRPSQLVRDQLPTVFAGVLRRLVRAVPGAIAACFCDLEGEAIDYWGELDMFEIKVAGAQLAGMHEDLRRRLGPFLGSAPIVQLRSERGSYLYVPVSDDYYVVALGSAYASWWEAMEDVSRARMELRVEAGVIP